jgi:hypothetical protein
VDSLLRNIDNKKPTLGTNEIGNTSKNIKLANYNRVANSSLFNKEREKLTANEDLLKRSVSKSTSMYDFFGINNPNYENKPKMDNTTSSLKTKKEKTENNAKRSNTADNLEVANKNDKSSAETGNHFKKASKKNEPKAGTNDDDLMLFNDQNLSEIENEITNIDQNKDIGHKLKKAYHTVNKDVIKPATGLIKEHPATIKLVLSIVKSAFLLLLNSTKAMMSACNAFIDGISSLIDKESADRSGNANVNETGNPKKSGTTFNKIIANIVSVACQIGIGIASGLSKLCIIYAVWDLAADTLKNLLLKIPLVSKFAEKHKIAFEVIFTAVSIIAKITTGICTGTLFAALTSSAVTLMFSLINIFKENEGALDKTLRFLKQNILHMKVHDNQELKEIEDEINNNFNEDESEDIGKLNNTNDNILIIPA